ncbi:MAG TPA: hypothetical protein VHW03_08815 [Chthoniobacterales bacterium]|nr:hypothetical protein [Chthoniobacterales bacterium]
MSKYKAVVDCSGYTGEALLPVALGVQTGMAGNPHFPDPPITSAEYALHVDAFQQALAAKASKATADIVAFNVARHQVESDFAELGGYVNIKAMGNQAMVVSSGFPYYETGATPDYNPPPAPTDVRLRQGDLSGSLIGRARTAKGRALLDVATCTGDPNVEANWNHAGMFSGGKVTINGIAPGTTVWVRMRSVGLKGVMGAWSDPAKIMVV